MKLLAFLGSMAVLAAVIGDAAALARILFAWLCVAVLVAMVIGGVFWLARRSDNDAEAMGLTDDRCRCCGGSGTFGEFGLDHGHVICQACNGGGLQPKGDA